MCSLEPYFKYSFACVKTFGKGRPFGVEIVCIAHIRERVCAVVYLGFIALMLWAHTNMWWHTFASNTIRMSILAFDGSVDPGYCSDTGMITIHFLKKIRKLLKKAGQPTVNVFLEESNRWLKYVLRICVKTSTFPAIAIAILMIKFSSDFFFIIEQ